MCSKIGTNQRNPLACALARGNGIVPTFATTSVGAVPYLPQKSTKFTANRRTLGGVFTIRYSSSCNNSKGFQHMAHLMINSDDQCENKAKMNAKAHSRQQMKFRWSVWTLDGRCGHPSANQNVASSNGVARGSVLGTLTVLLLTTVLPRDNHLRFLLNNLFKNGGETRK